MQVKYPTNTNEKDRELIATMAKEYQTPAKAFAAHPEWKAELKHLKYHSLIYFFNKYRNAGGSEPKAREEENLALVPVKKESNTETIDPMELLNYCPGCGFSLHAIKGALKLQAAGKI